MSCNCCTIECPAPEIISSSEGFIPSKGAFNYAIRDLVWDAIPIEYKQMKWNQYVLLENCTGEYVNERYCSLGNFVVWRTEITENINGGLYYDYPQGLATANPSGAERYSLEIVENGCATPPGSGFSTDTERTGNWEINGAGQLVWNYTETTLSGAPTTGTISASNRYPVGQSTPASALENTAVLGDDFMYQDTAGEYDYMITSLERSHGSGSWRVGYRDLADITVTITPLAEKFQQIRYKLLLEHWDTGAETVIEEEEWLYKTGDEPREITFTPPHPGILKITAFYRCSRKMPFKKIKTTL